MSYHTLPYLLHKRLPDRTTQAEAIMKFYLMCIPDVG